MKPAFTGTLRLFAPRGFRVAAIGRQTFGTFATSGGHAMQPGKRHCYNRRT